MLRFPASTVNQFYREVWSDWEKVKFLRLGQAFHQYMKLDKVLCDQDDRLFCDRLYQADGPKAKAMIAERTDIDN